MSRKPSPLRKYFAQYLARVNNLQSTDVNDRTAKIADSQKKKRALIEEIKERIVQEDENLALRIWKANLEREIRILDKAQRVLGQDASLRVLDHRLGIYKSATLEHLGKLVNADFDLLNDTVELASHGTDERFAFYDQIYDTGLSFVFSDLDAEKRAVQMALVPRNISRSKWIFMVALAARDCEIVLTEKEIALIGRMYNRLADHERGSENDTMPTDYKLRHNPAIHSLHTCTLIDHLFKNAERELAARYSDRNTTPSPRKIPALIRIEFEKLKQQLMLMALLHDMGEIDGELSQGMLKQALEAKGEVAAKFEHDRNNLETDIFATNLSGIAQTVYRDSPDDGKKTVEKFTTYFEATEQIGSFTGRFFKLCERLQSQSDYLRFNPKGHKVRKLEDTHMGNKIWSLNYATKIYRDAPMHGSEGKNSLRNLAEREQNPLLSPIYEALYNAAKVEFESVQDRLHAAFKVKGYQAPRQDPVSR